MTYVLPDGNIIDVAPNVSISRKCCSSQYSVANAPAAPMTFLSRWSATLHPQRVLRQCRVVRCRSFSFFFFEWWTYLRCCNDRCQHSKVQKAVAVPQVLVFARVFFLFSLLAEHGMWLRVRRSLTDLFPAHRTRPHVDFLCADCILVSNFTRHFHATVISPKK